MPESNDIIFESPPPSPDDDFWLEYGQKMLSDPGNVEKIEKVANSLLTVLGVVLGFIQGIYLAIIGFNKNFPGAVTVWRKAIFLIPVILWLMALYYCVRVVLDKRVEILLNSPDDIRKKSEQILEEKQRNLKWTFIFLVFGMISAVGLIVFSHELFSL